MNRADIEATWGRASKPERDRMMAEYRSQIGDVPLVRAMITWNRGPDYAVPSDGRVMIVPHPEPRRIKAALQLRSHSAAYMHKWTRGTKRQRVRGLIEEAWAICIRDKVLPENMHAALMAIPEYREAAAEFLQ